MLSWRRRRWLNHVPEHEILVDGDKLVSSIFLHVQRRNRRQKFDASKKAIKVQSLIARSKSYEVIQKQLEIQNWSLSYNSFKSDPSYLELTHFNPK